MIFRLSVRNTNLATLNECAESALAKLSGLHTIFLYTASSFF